MSKKSTFGCILNVRYKGPFLPFFHSSAIFSPRNYFWEVPFYTHIYLTTWWCRPLVIPMQSHPVFVCFENISRNPHCLLYISYNSVNIKKLTKIPTLNKPGITYWGFTLRFEHKKYCIFTILQNFTFSRQWPSLMKMWESGPNAMCTR